jgi:hypothetical protein
MTQVLTEQEKTRRAELNGDTRQALQMGLSLDEFLVARQACTEDWTGWLHREMQRCKTDDPVEVLPAALARVEQQAVAEARRAAENVARAEVQAHAIKEARRIGQETARTEIRALLQKAIANGDQRS